MDEPESTVEPQAPEEEAPAPEEPPVVLVRPQTTRGRAKAKAPPPSPAPELVPEPPPAPKAKAKSRAKAKPKAAPAPERQPAALDPSEVELPYAGGARPASASQEREPPNPMASLAAALHNARRLKEENKRALYQQFVFGNR